MRLRSAILPLTALACLLTGQAFASQLPLASFRLEAPSDVVEEGTNLPVRVTALDADGGAKDDYLGTVYFVVKGDPESKIPANKAQGYTFSAADAGSHLFSEGIVFSAPGGVEVIAIDLDNENVQGSKMVTVTRNPCKDSAALISILAPKDGVEVSSPQVALNGATRPNCGAQVLLNGTKAADVKADPKGAYALSLPGLKEGENVVTAILANGNKSTIRVNFVPDAVTITGPADGTVLTDTRATVTGTTGPGKEVTITVDGRVVGTGVAGPDGKFSIPVTGLKAGPEVLTATNKTGAKASVNVTVDASVTITGPADRSTLTGSRTDVTGVTVPDVNVTVSSGPGCSATGKSGPDGKFSIPLACLKGGANAITATNDRGGSASVNVTVDVSVRITGPADGSVLTDVKTVVTGVTVPGAAVSVSCGPGCAASGPAGADGKFSIPLSGLKNGPNVITAANDLGGRASVNVRVERTVVITSPAPGGRLTGPASGSGSDSDPSSLRLPVTVTGRASPGAPVSVRVGGRDVCWGSAGADGNFSIPGCQLPSCDVAIVADQRDAAGKTVASSAPVPLKVLPDGNACDQSRFTCLKGSRAAGRVTLDFCVAPDGDGVRSFRVLTGATCDALSGSVDTLPKGRMYGPDWKNYRWWVPAAGGPLAVKVLALGPDGKPTGLPSECLQLDDGQCEIGSVAGVRATADVPRLRSELSWDPHPDAASYNVYVHPEAGAPLAFLENVARPPYEVRMSPDRVAFRDYVVRGVCRPGAQPSADLGNATKVQTGPATWILAAAALLAAALALRYAAVRKPS